MALAEGVWLAIRIEAPSPGFLSYPKGFPSVFVTSPALMMLLGWAEAHYFSIFLRKRILMNFTLLRSKRALRNESARPKYL